MMLIGKLKYSEKTYPSANLSIGLGWKLGPLWREIGNCPHHGTA